ncbi:F-box protein At2g26160-like [Telopea speciosissima]|uniref:F-box protein At2g26160-like n=1 Tax=Telopea speciosissima TaxID=54955 RepID=UPI001CC6DA89|nr:F-box protein At2g26160-like [Telopea speciosissima]
MASSVSDDCNGKRLKNSIDCHGVNKSIMFALPEDIKFLIVNKLDVVDLHCFSSVCKSWQSIAMAAKKIQPRPPQLPWLMFSSFNDHRLVFFRLTDGKVLRLEIPETYFGSQCVVVGSNWGWLIMVDKMRRTNFLLNPFTRIVIQLPPLDTLPIHYDNDVGIPSVLFRIVSKDNFINKAMLLSPPAAAATTTNNSTLNDCVVIAIYCNNELAFCRPGDDAWTSLGIYFKDIILCHGKLYAITEQFDLKLVKLGGFNPKIKSCNIAPPVAKEDLSPLQKSFYLVECLGELLMVIKYYVRDYNLRYHYTSLTFKIFKLDLKGRRWIKVEDLGDRTLFIGTSTSLSVSARDHPGLKGNCIYFTDHEDFGNRGPKVYETLASLFHLEDNSTQHLSSYGLGGSPSTPIWITPIF